MTLSQRKLSAKLGDLLLNLSVTRHRARVNLKRVFVLHPFRPPPPTLRPSALRPSPPVSLEAINSKNLSTHLFRLLRFAASYVSLFCVLSEWQAKVRSQRRKIPHTLRLPLAFIILVLCVHLVVRQFRFLWLCV